MSGLDPLGALWLAFELSVAAGFVGLCVYALVGSHRPTK